MIRIKIADTVYKINIADNYIDELMYRFIFNDPRVEDVYVDVTQGKMPLLNESAIEDMKIRGHSMYIDNGFIYYMQTEEEFITYMKYDKAFTYFQININEEVNLHELTNQQTDQLTAILNGMISKVVLMDATIKKGIWLHCVALKYKKDAILFSAKSRTGKTTHTNFWKEIFNGVEIINGDNGLCFPEDVRPCVYGSPWAGTSDDCMNIKVPIRAVVFLEQAAENSIAKLDIPEAFMRLSARCFMPAWDRELTIKALDTAESLVQRVDCYLLKCLPNHDAARMVERELYR